MNSTGNKNTESENRWSPETLATIGRLDFIALEVLDGVRQGLHRSIRRGFSSEFFDYKNYQDGDDATKIDWRLFAKTNKFYIKRFEAETSLECMIITDFSESMRWKWRDTVSKLEYASMTASALALLFSRQRDLVGLHSFGILPQRHLNPRASAKHSELFISMMTPPIQMKNSSDNTEKLPTLLETARGAGSILQHRGLVILFSDFEMPENEIRESLSLIRARGHELVVFHLLDIAEIKLPFDDVTHFLDSESNEMLPVNIEELRNSQPERIANFRAMVTSACSSVNAVYVPVDTSESPVDAILNMNRVRKEQF